MEKALPYRKRNRAMPRDEIRTRQPAILNFAKLGYLAAGAGDKPANVSTPVR